MIIAHMSTIASSSFQPAVDRSHFSGAAPLPDWGLIRAHGADTVTFLQGQLTNELAGAGTDQARLAGYCSAKGRLLASFVAWQAGGADDWLLACSADLVANVVKRLSMFVMRAQCKVTAVGDELEFWGLAGNTAVAWLGDRMPPQPWSVTRPSVATQVIRLPDVDGVIRCLWVGPIGEAPTTLPRLAPQAWRWLEVQSGVARILSPTVEAFVPQMVNFELVGGVNFKKGCYPGQEVVARSQYRGTLKRRGVLLQSDAPLTEGQEVFSEAEPDQPAGQIALAANWEGVGHVAFTELKRAAADQTLHLGSAQGPQLRLLPLPYSLPSDDQ